MAETTRLRKTVGRTPVVALLPWGDLIEDFLDSIGVSLEEFCTTMTGGWLFGYISALDSAGIRTRLICVSARVNGVKRYVHVPTGAQVSVLPASRSYIRIRRQRSHEAGQSGKPGVLRRLVRAGRREILPYLATPMRRLLSELRYARCTAIICQEYEYPRFDACVAAGTLLQIPVFASFQGSNFHTGRLEHFVRPLSMRQCRGLIIGSHSEAARVCRSYNVPASKIARIFNPLDVAAWHTDDRTARRRQLGMNENSTVVVWHGRVDVWRKGLDTLLDAWKIVELEEKEEVPRLLLLGTGSDADYLRRGIDERRLHDVFWRNEYLLDREEIRGYLAAADLYVLPSRHEGFAVAPLEAMACGLPVVATDVPGVKDTLEGGEFSGGIIVPPNDPVQLAEGILRLLQDREFRRTLGDRARKTIENNFSWEIVGRQLHSVLLSRDSGRVRGRKLAEES